MDVQVEINSFVTKGQVLAQLDPATYHQRVKQAEADLAAAEANHQLLELDARRSEELRNKGMISAQDHDRTQAGLKQAAATLLTRRAAFENTKLDLERCTLRAPIDGHVIYKAAEPGKTVAASLSAPVLFVVAQDLRKMRIIAPISEVDIWAVKVGQSALFTLEGLSGRTFNGQIAQIRNPYTPAEKSSSPGQASQAAITYFDAIIEVDNPDLILRPGLNASIQIVTESAAGVLLVPNAALSVRLPPTLRIRGSVPAGQGVVYLMKPGADPAPVLVRLGISDGNATSVDADLREGDLLVTGVAKTRQ